MYSLRHPDGSILFEGTNWFTIAAELRIRGIHYLIVEAIRAWFDMNRGKEFEINKYIITEA